MQAEIVLPIRPDTAPADPIGALRDRPDRGQPTDLAEALRPVLIDLARLVRQGMDGDCRLINARQLAETLGISSATLERLLASGKVPRPIKLGGCHRWPLETIRSWIAANCPDRRTWESMQSTTPRRTRP